MEFFIFMSFFIFLITKLTILPLITSTDYITPTLLTILSCNYLTLQTITIVEWLANLCPLDVISTGKTMITMNLLFPLKA